MSIDPATLAQIQNYIAHLPDQNEMDLVSTLQTILQGALALQATNTTHIADLETRIATLEAAANITPAPGTTF